MLSLRPNVSYMSADISGKRLRCPVIHGPSPAGVSPSLNVTTALPFSFHQNRRSASPYFLGGKLNGRILQIHFTDVHCRRDHLVMPSRKSCLSAKPLASIPGCCGGDDMYHEEFRNAMKRCTPTTRPFDIHPAFLCRCCELFEYPTCSPPRKDP